MYMRSGDAFGGGAASSGSTQLSPSWFFGEGATGPFFQAFLSMVNPGMAAATVTVTYHMSDGSTASQDYAIPGEGRRTVYLNAEGETDPALAPLASGPVWFTVSSTQPILAERAMWWSTWPWYEGHAAPGSVATDVSWAIPEGRHGGADLQQTYVLIVNTSSTAAASVRVTLIPDEIGVGAASTHDFTLDAGQRQTLNIGDEFGLTDARFSVIVDSLGSPGVPLTVDYARYRSVNGVPFSGGGAAPAVAVTAAGDRAPSLANTTPAANAIGVAVDAPFTVTFSEPVQAAPGAFALSCGGTPVALTTITSSPAPAFTLAPAIDLPTSTACALRIHAAAVTDVDTLDPPDTMAVDITVPFTTSSCPAIRVTASVMPVPGGVVSLPYGPIQFSANGAVGPSVWSISTDAPPPGLTFSPAAELSGTPTVSGAYSFTVRAATDAGCAGSLPVTVTVAPRPNDAPAFTAGADVTVNEDAGPQVAAGWATAIGPGQFPEDAAQNVSFVVTSNTKPALFAVPPSVSPDGSLTFTPAPDANGFALITIVAQDDGGTANGGDDTSDPRTFRIAVTPVNDAPSFILAATHTVLEDSGPRIVAGSASAISAGPVDESGQTVTFTITGNTNPALFSAAPAMAADGTLTFTPAAETSGTATLTLTLSDNGGGSDTSAPQQVAIAVEAVNDAPSFTAGADETVLEDSGPHTVPSWATGMDAGPADESGQTLTFVVTANTNPALFSAGPSVAADGTLTYTPAADASGVADITLALQDDGGTLHGGVDAAARTFTITITDVNDAPSFTAGAAPTSAEDAGARTILNWATAITPGPPREASQTLTFAVTSNTNPALFSTAPAISPAGTLTYTSAVDAFGTADITIVLQDSGDTSNGGANTSSPPYTFTVTITPVNDLMSFTNATVAYSTLGNTQLHASGATLAGLASIADANGVLSKAVPADADGPVAPSVVPAAAQATPNGIVSIAADGSFTYMPNAGFTGTDTFVVQVTDSIAPVDLTVQVAVGPTVWYVSNRTDADNPATGSDGRSNNAFETIADASAASNAGDTIFIFEGDTATTPLISEIALKDGQKLLGEGVGLTIAPFGTVVPAGTRPRLTGVVEPISVTANAANGPRTGIEIRGLDVTGTHGFGIVAQGRENNALGLRISENTVSLAGTAFDGIAVGVNNSPATLAIHDNTVSAPRTGIRVTDSGSGTTTITAFDDNVVTGVHQGGIQVENGVFDAIPGGPLDPVDGGITRIGSPGDPVPIAPGYLALGLNFAGALDFVDLDVYSAAGAVYLLGRGPYSASAGSRVTSTPGASTFVANGGPAVLLVSLTTDLQLAGLTSTDSPNDGVHLFNMEGNFSAPAGSAIANAAGTDFFVYGSNVGVTYGGTIIDDVGPLVQVLSSQGTIDFIGAIADGNDGDGGGILLNHNFGGTIRFSGGLTLSTGATDAFTASNGGTVAVCDEHPCNAAATGAVVNNLETTTGTALTVKDMTIGADTLEFRSISVDGANQGIALENTGTLGGLEVTGNVTAGSGGTIQNVVTRGASFIQSNKISLAHMRFLNANTTDGAVADGGVGGSANKDEHGAIYFEEVVQADLTDLLIDGTAQHGINGNSVTNLEITDTTILNVGDATWEASINLVDLNGVGSSGLSNVFSGLHITNDSGANNIAVVNTYSSELGNSDRLEITDSFFSRVGSNPVISDNISISSRLGASLHVTVSNSTFSSTHSCGAGLADACVQDAIHADVRDFARFDLDVATGNDFTGAAAGASAINLTASGGLGLFDVRNITTTVGSLAAIKAAVTGTDPSATLRGRIINNHLSTSAPLATSGIEMVINGAGTMAVEVADNIIEGDASNRFLYGILGGAQAGTGRTEFVVRDNQVDGADIAGASFFAGNGTGGETNRTCVRFTNNRIDGFDVPSTALADYLLRMFPGTMFNIEGLTGSGTDASNVAGFVAATDTDPSPTNPVVDLSTGPLVNYTVSGCVAPF